ncbi:FadR/GntR family transcriptional regulator [Tropicimonas sp.]|uniref:FadR/GntR family transcriptional regulator n=1 Tax=Tropicimonas sp. TaxID=2067044 RepID=UPI003A8A309E
MKFAASGRLDSRARNNSDEVVEQLGIAIVAGEYPADTLIPLDPDLEEIFGVSRTVIREAKKTLVAKGLLQSKAKVGTRVRPAADWSMFDPDVLRWHTVTRRSDGFIDDLFEIRLILEPEAAAMLAGKQDAEGIGALAILADRLARTEGLRDFLTLDLEFHKAILRASDNRFMRSLGDLVEITYNVLLNRLDRKVSPMQVGSMAEDAAGSHRKLVQAIGEGDAAGARAAMVAVIHEARARMKE